MALSSIGGCTNEKQTSRQRKMPMQQVLSGWFDFPYWQS
jgi:hypothetical protein